MAELSRDVEREVAELTGHVEAGREADACADHLHLITAGRDRDRIVPMVVRLGAEASVARVGVDVDVRQGR